jgi:hypothetical protein
MPPSTTLSSIGAAALLLAAAQLLPLTSAQSSCRWEYSSSCNPGSKKASYDVTFEVDNVSSANQDGYPVTVIFHWGVEKEEITDTYIPGNLITLSESYTYDDEGYYTTGFSLIFGDGAAGCEGKTITRMETLEMGSSCDFIDGVAPPPTPAPVGAETPEPTPAPDGVETKEPTHEPTEKQIITESPTLKPTVAPSPRPTTPRPTNPPTTIEPVVTTTTVATTAVTTTETVATDPSSTTTATVPATDSSTTTSTEVPPTTTTTSSSSTTTETLLSQRHLVPSSMTLYNVGELDSVALSKWKEKTKQQITLHSENEDITVTLENVSQVPTGSRRFLRQLQEEQLLLQHTRSLVEDGSLQINFYAVIETESTDGLSKEDANAIVTSGFSTSARQTEYIYSLKSADSTTFGDIDRMAMVVDGTTVVTSGINPIQKPPGGGGGGDGGGSSMWIIIGVVAGGALVVFIVIGSIFYTKRRRQLEPSRSESPVSKGTNGMTGDDIMGKEWSTMQPRGPHSQDEVTCASPYLGTIESREGEDDVSTLGDPYFGEAIDARDTGTVAESMVSSDMLALGVKRRAIGSSNASRMDATTATGFTSGLGSTYPMTFADDTTLDDAYQTPDAVGYEEEEDEDYERIVVVAPPGKLGIVIDNPSGNIPFVHAIKETSVLHGRVQVGDLVLSVDEVDCRGMHSMSVSRLISKRSDSARTLKLLRNTSC